MDDQRDGVGKEGRAGSICTYFSIKWYNLENNREKFQIYTVLSSIASLFRLQNCLSIPL